LYQKHLGVDQTGTLAVDQAVFLPAPVRVTSVTAQAVSTAAPGSPVFQGTATTRQVTVALDAAEQAYVKAGDRVTITLPDNQTTPGVEAGVEAALADYYQATAEANRIRSAARRKADATLADAERAAAGPDKAACDATRRLRDLLGGTAEVAELCGISVVAVRELLAAKSGVGTP
jgi:hypothetical protein